MVTTHHGLVCSEAHTRGKWRIRISLKRGESPAPVPRRSTFQSARNLTRLKTPGSDAV
jgi:hypothetical protein